MEIPDNRTGHRFMHGVLFTAVLGAGLGAPAMAQLPSAAPRGAQSFTPVEMPADGAVAFRMYAPGTKAVEVIGMAPLLFR